MSTTAQTATRRREVARLRAAGRELEQIAAELGCSRSTVAADVKVLGLAAPRSNTAAMGRTPVLDPDATGEALPGAAVRG